MSRTVLYKFEAAGMPHGEIWVAAHFENEPDAEEMLVNYPKRYMDEHSECIELLSSSTVRFERVTVK